MNGFAKLAAALRGRGLVNVAAEVAVGAAHGGAVGAAGVVLSKVAKSLGVPDADPDVLYQAVTNASDMDLAPLRQFDADLVMALSEDQVRLAEIESADRADARSAHKGHWMTWFLPLLIAAMWCGWRAILVWADVSSMTPESVADTSTALNNLLVLAFGYWLGSSIGSSDRGRTIDKMVSR